jgi:hypothetical protein
MRLGDRGVGYYHIWNGLVVLQCLMTDDTSNESRIGRTLLPESQLNALLHHSLASAVLS